MRCSLSETLLDRYVEGTLPSVQMAAVGAHLAACPACTALLSELRVVDALLATTQPAELAPNFTFALMAEVRTMAVPAPKSAAPWPILAFYLVVTWILACAALLVGRFSWVREALAPAGSAISNAAAAIAGILHGLSPAAPVAAGVGVAILVLDVVLAIGVMALYRIVQPRLAARLSRTEAS